MKQTRIYLLMLLCLVVGSGCGLADIRPEGLKKQKQITATQRQKGQALIAQMQQAHGGRQAWLAHRNAQVVMVDSWPGFLTRVFAMPWATNDARLRQTMLLGQDISRLEFLNGKDQDSAWGIQYWKTYKVPKHGVPTFRDDDQVLFYLPTLQYFFEAPFRLGEAQYVAYTGTKDLNGRRYDLVYVTWGSVKPNTKSDQYVLWIDQKTKLLAYLHYTVRDAYKFLSGAAIYKGYHPVQGIMVPKTIQIVGGVEEDRDDIVHQISVEKVRFGVSIPSRFLIPKPSSKGKK